MSEGKQSKWKKWILGFLLGTVIPSYLGYIWLNERPPLRFDKEKFQSDHEQFIKDMKKYSEAFESLKENEQQDEPVEEQN